MRTVQRFKYRRDGTPLAANAVWRLVSGFPAGQREAHRIAVLEPQAFIDDSTDQPDRKFLVLAGFVSSASRWAEFSDAWQAALDLEPKLEYFKMNEATLLKEQFSPDWGWTEALRDERVALLARIITDHALVRLHASIRRSDFEENISKISVPERTLLSDSPYTYLFIKLIVAMAIRSTVIGINEPCDFIFDEQDGYAEEIWRQWPQFREVVEATKNPKFPTFLGAKPNFQNDKCFKPLQAADLFANQMRFHVQRNAGGIFVPPNRTLQQLLLIPGISHDSTSDELKQLGELALRWKEALLKPNTQLVGFAETSREQKRNRKLARKAAKKASSEEQPF